MVYNLRLNYNKLMMKETGNAERHSIIDDCFAQIGDKWYDLLYKHDGCRILQAFLKYGNRPQRETVVDKIKDQFVHLASQKYSHYLASKMFVFAPREDQKTFLRKELSG